MDEKTSHNDTSAPRYLGASARGVRLALSPDAQEPLHQDGAVYEPTNCRPPAPPPAPGSASGSGSGSGSGSASGPASGSG